MIRKYEHYRSEYDEVVIDSNDYLQVSAIVKALETKMLTRAQFDRMAEASEDSEVLRVLTEAGYASFDIKDPDEMNKALERHREELFAYLEGSVPDERYFDIFKIKYDYHNAKVLLKAKAAGVDADSLLSEGGRVDVKELKEAFEGGDLKGLPDDFADALSGAGDVLETTGDAELTDVFLDRLMIKERMRIALSTGSKFLLNYAGAMADDANLRAAVRALRMGKNAEFLQNVLAEGFEVSAESISASVRNAGVGLADLYHATPFSKAAEAGSAALKGGSLSEFERLCDDALFGCLEDARYKAYGEEPLAAYLAEIEVETRNIRIVVMGRNAGFAPEEIRLRLRASYS